MTNKKKKSLLLKSNYRRDPAQMCGAVGEQSAAALQRAGTPLLPSPGGQKGWSGFSEPRFMQHQL